MSIVILTTGTPQYNFSFDITIQDYSQAYNFLNNLSCYTLGSIILTNYNITTATGTSSIIKIKDITIYYLSKEFDFKNYFQIKDRQNYNFKENFNVKDLDFKSFTKVFSTAFGIYTTKFKWNITKLNRQHSFKKFYFIIKDKQRLKFQTFMTTKRLGVLKFNFLFKTKDYVRYNIKQNLYTGLSGNVFRLTKSIKVPYSIWEYQLRFNLPTLVYNAETEIIVEESYAS